MACTRCGACCDPVVLRATKSEIRGDRQFASDEFILRYWRRVSKEEAFRRRPILRRFHAPGRYYYDCVWFDRETRLCTARAFRPPICRAFPESLRCEGRPLRLRSYPECGYNLAPVDEPMPMSET
jgi:Fe-S-cluster containining protein